MCILKYRLIGDVSNPVLTKEFESRDAMREWVKACGNIMILTVTESCAPAMARVFEGN
jgi:hypothetical protein